MWSYLKTAFLAGPDLPGLGRVPANVLALLGAAALGFLNPGFWLLGLAAEAVFLFGLATHPRFRKYVDAQKAKAARGQHLGRQPPPDDTAQRILRELPAAAVKRFEALRKNCQELQQIAAQLRDPHGRKDQLHCHFDDFTVDVPCNQLAKATAECVLAWPPLGAPVP